MRKHFWLILTSTLQKFHINQVLRVYRPLTVYLSNTKAVHQVSIANIMSMLNFKKPVYFHVISVDKRTKILYNEANWTVTHNHMKVES